MKRILLFQAFSGILLIVIFGVLLSNYSDSMQVNTKQNNSSANKVLPEELLFELQGDESNHSLLVLNIWESWCIPCINEILELNRIFSDFKDKGIDFVAVTSSKKEACELVLEKNKIEFNYRKLYNKPQFINRIDSIYFKDQPNHKQIVPQHIILNNNGEILLFLVGASDKNLLKLRMFIENYSGE